MVTPDHGRNIITRGLPKTGQTVEYSAGDDGTHEAGWWRGRLNANNRERWILKLVGPHQIVIDRATGLMWAANGNAGGCNNGLLISWAAAIIYANGLNFADFTDWRLPNRFELASILRIAGAAPFIEEPPFSNTFSGRYWSSTTDPLAVNNAYCVDFSNTTIERAGAKTDLLKIRAVRGGL